MMKDIDLCSTCQANPPLFQSGRMFKNCAGCLDNLRAKKQSSGTAKRNALRAKMDAANPYVTFRKGVENR